VTFLRRANHHLETTLDCAPVGFNVVGARSSRQVGEVLTVVHSLVLIPQRRQLTVGGPLV